jgi:Effector-associated domain 1
MSNIIFARLRKILSFLCSSEQDVRRVATDSGIDLTKIIFNSSVINIWDSVLTEARKNNQIDVLLGIVKVEYPTNSEFQEVYGEYERVKSFDTYQQLSQEDHGNSAKIEHLNAQEYAVRILENEKGGVKITLQNPLSKDANEVRDWFFKELQSKEQSLLLATALFGGMSRQKLMEVMTDIELILSADD